MPRLLKFISLLLALWFLTACQTIETEPPPAQPAITTEPADAVAVTRVVSTSAPPGTAVVCDDAGDVALQVDTLAGAKVSMQIEGLQPGESPKFIFTRQDPPDRGLTEITTNPLATAAPDSVYTFSQDFSVVEAETSRWKLHVIHEAGVTCTEFTLQPPRSSP